MMDNVSSYFKFRRSIVALYSDLTSIVTFKNSIRIIERYDIFIPSCSVTSPLEYNEHNVEGNDESGTTLNTLNFD